MMMTMRKHTLIGAAFAFLVFVLFATAYTHWGFDIDDCGMIYGSWKVFLQGWAEIFKCKDNSILLHASNYVSSTTDVIPYFYRPFTVLFFAWQYILFQANAYYYFLVMIFFHIINTLFVFYILFALIDSFKWALYGSFFFCFHITLWCWMGWIAAQPYVISLSFLFLSMMLFIHFLRAKKLWSLIASAGVYFGALLLFEMVVFYPLGLLVCWGIFDFLNPRLRLSNINFLAYLKSSLIFWIITGFYFFLRLSVSCSSYLKQTTAISWANLYENVVKSLFCSFSARMPDVYSFFVDLCNICFIPGGNRLLKGTLVVLILISFGYLIYKSSHKKLFFLLSLCFFICMWRIVMARYFPRYFYYALVPFSMFVTVIIKDYYDYLVMRKKNISAGVFFISVWGIVCGNVYFLNHKMKVREHRSQICMKASSELVKKLADNTRPLCFIGLPHNDFRTGFGQMLWMQGLSPAIKIYYDNVTFVGIANDRAEGILSAYLIAGGIRLTSLNQDKLWIIGYDGPALRIGKRIVNEIDEQLNRVYSVDYIFNEDILREDPLFITWDYQLHRFKFIT